MFKHTHIPLTNPHKKVAPKITPNTRKVKIKFFKGS